MMRRRLSAGLVVIAVVAAGCGSGGGGQQAEPTRTPSTGPTATAAPTTPSVQPSGPSQSKADAKRDGVIAPLAALPLRIRSQVGRSITTPEGVWALSRPAAGISKYTVGCRLGPDTGDYPTTTICTTEYGELLLLSADQTRILRAYPLPAVPPDYLVVTPEAVYCGRGGDPVMAENVLPDSMVCRVDRKTFRATVRIFPGGDDSVVAQPCFYAPSCWTVDKRFIAITEMKVDARGLLLRGRNATWTLLDPTTLVVKQTGLKS
jgi:hypothetical protein